MPCKSNEELGPVNPSENTNDRDGELELPARVVLGPAVFAELTYDDDPETEPNAVLDDLAPILG